MVVLTPGRGTVSMIDVVWAVLLQDNRFLLAQRSLNNRDGGTWVFPGGKIDPEDKTAVDAVYKELKKEVGLKGKQFRKIFHILLGKYRVQVFLCNKWSNLPSPACEYIIGVGWFTLPEMYALGQTLSPFANSTLPYLAYMMQHYNSHSEDWHEPWEECDGNV